MPLSIHPVWVERTADTGVGLFLRSDGWLENLFVQMRERGLEAAGKDAVVGGACRPTSSSAKRPLPHPCRALDWRAGAAERSRRGAAKLDRR